MTWFKTPPEDTAYLQEALRAEVEKWEQKSYGELSEMVFPVAYEHGSTGDKDWYAVEVSRLERTPE